jgi:hypothetical protein
LGSAGFAGEFQQFSEFSRLARLWLNLSSRLFSRNIMNTERIISGRAAIGGLGASMASLFRIACL